jgi:uncharacterized protein YjbI with pentapeptide repeats
MSSTETPDIRSLEIAVNDASSRATALWFSFLTFAAYLTVAVGSVSHRTLFLETAIKLPVLNVDLPLVGFFFVAPSFFLLFHFYLFLQLVILARKVMTYKEVLSTTVASDHERDKFRRRLDTFIIVQILSGAENERSGPTGRLLRTVAVITLIVLPILLLVQIQLTFLPYHLYWVTWAHRMAICADLGLIWVFWPTILNPKDEIARPPILRHWGLSAATLAVVLIDFLVFVFPGEYVDMFFRRFGTPISDLVLRTSIDPVKNKSRGLFSNVLILQEQKFVEEEKLDKQNITISLRGRDLRGAIMSHADLRKADFVGANLQGADLRGAVLSGAKFNCVTSDQEQIQPPAILLPKRWPSDGCTWLQGATLDEAVLAGADLRGARLYGASMQRANLSGATLQHAQLQGATLTNASLQATDFASSDLQGAILDGASLFGASFDYANLQGASFREARFGAATFSNSAVWRTKVQLPEDPAAMVGLAFVGTENLITTSLDYPRLLITGSGDKREEYESWLDRIEETLFPEDRARSKIKRLLSVLDPGRNGKFETSSSAHNTTSENEDSDLQHGWGQLRAFKAKTHDASLMAEFLIGLACQAGMAPYTARGLIRNTRIYTVGNFMTRVIDKFKDPEACPGAHGLARSDMEQLSVYSSANAPPPTEESTPK